MHPIDDAAQPGYAAAQSRCFLDLAHHRVLEALAEMDEAAGNAPLARGGGLAAPSEENALAVEHHGPHRHARSVGEFSRRPHQTMVSARGARPDHVQSWVPRSEERRVGKEGRARGTAEE